MRIENIIHHSRSPFNSRNFDEQEGYCLTLSVRSSFHLRIQTGIYFHWCNNVLVRIAVDLSSMTGCPLGCKFCASSIIPDKIVLTSEEIAEQGRIAVQFVKNTRSELFLQNPIFNFSFSGIGEPSLDFVVDNICDAIIKLRNSLNGYPQKLHFNISTNGIKAGNILKWANPELYIRSLQFSIHALSLGLRQKLGLVDIDLKEVLYKIKKLGSLCPNMDIKINYLMMKIGNTDNISHTELDKLITLIQDSGFALKLSYLNPTTNAESNDISALTQTEIADTFMYVFERYPNTYIFGTDRDLGISCGQFGI